MASTQEHVKWDSRTRVGFWALIVTQFQGAFNDNLFRFLIIMFLGRLYMDWHPDSPGVVNQVTAVTGVLFAIPFLLFPVIAGVLADKFNKRNISVSMKCAELAIMLLGMAAFWLESPWFVWGCLFLMLTQSTFFSPAKYGIMPEMLPTEKLSWGNGVLNMTTYLAIILGAAAAGPTRDWLGEYTYLMALPLVVLSLIGLGSSFFIYKPPPANPSARVPVNPWSGLGSYFRVIYQDKRLLLSVVGIAFFFFTGALVEMNIYRLGWVDLGLEDDTPISIMQAALAIGIGVGSLTAGVVSRKRIELGLVPFGALGLVVFSALLAIPGTGFWACVGLLLGLAFFGGFYIVPFTAMLQHRSPVELKGTMIAASNFVTFSGVLLAGGLYYLLGMVEIGSRAVFLLTAALVLAAAFYLCWQLPLLLLRFALWVVANTVFRVKVLGGENVPEDGGALLVANNSSIVDALILVTSAKRPVRFFMARGYWESPWVRRVAGVLQATPAVLDGDSDEAGESFKAISGALREGELVCILPEGQVTLESEAPAFREGFGRILEDAGDAPVIPAHLDRVWGTLFTFDDGKFHWKWPRRIPHRITVSFGEPLPGDTDRATLRRVIRELGTEAYSRHEPDQPLLHRMFIKTARRRPRKLAIADARSGALSYFRTLAGSIVLARKLKPIIGDAEMTGTMLPPSVGGALTNIALQTLGSVPVNLNYTLGEDGLKHCVSQCEMEKIITSRAFLEAFPVEVPLEAVYLEDIMKSVTGKDRVLGAVLALVCPVRVLERILGSRGGRTCDDLATIIFSSGSEAKPKGILLTHRNILSNVEASLQVFPHKRGDGVMGILPFFHSFGFTVTIWLPFHGRMFAVYHPTPLEPRAIGELIEKYKPKLFLATSTLLQGFIRRCSEEQMSSLGFVVCGAEKLADRVRDAFKEKFGLEPLEGYGTTECAPVVSVNIPDLRAPGFYQKGSKRGTIGRPLPGISVRVTDPETGDVLPEGEEGMLHVKGPNIMQGYLHMPEKTREVLNDGWYETGDMAYVDGDEFITITGRLTRFSKIGGEMVPHTMVEEKLHKLLGLTDLSLAVSGVRDPEKGERLVVLHTLEDEQLEELQEKLKDCDLPRLWVPRPSAFHRVDEIPVLGTGKMDIKKVQNTAEELSRDE